ncbi:hypothetical protein [Siphonobacter sp. SORGH_AS_1065]|uniref:hypothetical protein n=1 Tax=Siphonobacter sp. SORGH_AS_1065 TaxID=3041795 RepID=UPI0027803C47|nr:hypothetical protein [Siphonobacter sp. SORGH_AS_1065]MDQ1089708.1 hypothetical protein [Siphonobacter sp. SORGH_AS_1065]
MWKYVCFGLLLFSITTQAQEADSLFLQESTQAGGARVRFQRLPAEGYMKTRLHLVSDFLKKLNDTTASEEYPVAEIARSARLRELINTENTHLSGDDLQRFIDQIGAEKIANPQEHLYAEVLLETLNKGENRTLKVYLKKQKISNNWSWQLIGTEAFPPLDSSYSLEEKADSSQFIPPNAQELNFMALPGLFRKEISPFWAASARTNPDLLAMNQQIKEGKLQIIHSLETKLWLDTQLGWYLELRQLNRESENSGWLIHDLINDVKTLPQALLVFLQQSNK